MKYLILLVAVTLTGCATPPYWLSEMFDANDPCQKRNYVDKPPNFCGAAGNRTYIYATPNNSPLGAPIGYIKR